MGKKNWFYVDDPAHQSHGDMVCISCHQLIEHGSYRVRDAGDKYIIQHRLCSSFDPMWERRDREHQKIVKELEAKVNAYRAFRDRWNEYDLDETIERMEQQLEAAKARLPS